MHNLSAAAAKSLQSCPTLCDPIDSSPLGSPVPGILQARTLEWVAISFSNAWKWKMKVKSLSRVRPSATPWSAAFQAPPSVGCSRQEYWSGVPLPSPTIYLYPPPQILQFLWWFCGHSWTWAEQQKLWVELMCSELRQNSATFTFLLQLSFCQQVLCMWFTPLCLALVILLFKIAPSIVLKLWLVFLIKKAVICHMEKVCVLDVLVS